MIKIGAVVLAAGLSSRMGQPKMLLPWKNSLVIQSIVQTLTLCNLAEIIVVTGAYHKEIEAALSNWSIRTAYNLNYGNGEMLLSFQVGLRKLKYVDAVLLVLGDQPQIQASTIEEMLTQYTGQTILIPSYKMRRGHPWIINRSVWSDIISLHPPRTLREFLNQHNDQIHYLDIDTPSILNDMDTPEDYKKLLTS
jgi:molybdenum cofactor cytidylyltransferase